MPTPHAESLQRSIGRRTRIQTSIQSSTQLCKIIIQFCLISIIFSIP